MLNTFFWFALQCFGFQNKGLLTFAAIFSKPFEPSWCFLCVFTVHFAIYFKTDSIFALDSIILTWHSSEWLLFSYLQIKNSKTKNTKLKEIVMKQKTIDKSNGSFKFSFQINFVATFEHSSQNTSNIEILCPSRVLDNSKLSTNYDTSYNFERNYFKRILLSQNFAAQFLV